MATLPQPVQPIPDPVLPPPPRYNPPPLKPVDVPAAPVEKPADNTDGSTAVALADDPTIKTLTAKLADNPDDANALYRRGQVYASKGA